MFYELLKATEGRWLFTAKNFHRGAVKKQPEKLKTNDIEDSNVTKLFIYKKEHENWIDEETGEIFIPDEKIKHYEKEIEARKSKKNKQ